VLLSADCVVHTLAGDCFVADLLQRIGPSFGFSWDGERVTVNRFMLAGSHVGQPVEIELDDDARIACDQEAKVVLLNTKTARPLDLNSVTSLLPLYFKLSHDHVLYREPGNWFKGGKVAADRKRWRKVSRMVAEWSLGRRLENGEQVRILNGDRANCRPDNVVIDNQPYKKPKKVKSFADPIFEGEKLIQEIENDPRLGLKLPRRPRNHKLIRAEIGVSRDLFSIKTFDLGNLAINGIFFSE
jgi:hypothetical protein